MELLAARVDGARMVVGVGWRSDRNPESGFDIRSTCALLDAHPCTRMPSVDGRANAPSHKQVESHVYAVG